MLFIIIKSGSNFNKSKIQWLLILKLLDFNE